MEGGVCQACGAGILDIDVSCAGCGAPLTSTGAQRRIGSVVLDQYKVTEILGQGGMSVVYKARHKLTEQEVALKILPPELAAHAQVKSRFLDEARALGQLDHPNIVHLYNFGQDDDCFVLAMQFVQGRTWERMIMEQGKLDWRRSVEIAIDVLRALEYAHQRGVVHRDMKPSNVLVRADGSATVMDFGIAKMTTSSRLTATGQTMGTVRYMSPEQVRGLDLDLRSDIYSLAVTLYESLTGETPFDGESHFEIMTAHLNTPPAPVRDKAAGVPPQLDLLVMRALAKAPADRPATADELRRGLEEVLAGREVSSPGLARAGMDTFEMPVAGRRGRSGLWLGLVTLVLLGGGGAVFLATHRGGGDGAANDGGLRSGKPQAWPEPFLLPELRFQVDQRFADEHLRVLAVSQRSAEDVRDELVRARRRFLGYLDKQKVVGVDAPALTVAFVPRHVLCDPRIYDKGQPAADCAERQFYYRPIDLTLYLDEAAEDWVIAFDRVVAVGMCLHSNAAGCDAAAASYVELLMSSGSGASNREP